jgi:hypothetical protein
MLGWGRSKAGNVDRQKCLRPKAVSRRRIASFEDVKTSSGRRASGETSHLPKPHVINIPDRSSREPGAIQAAANRLMAVLTKPGRHRMKGARSWQCKSAHLGVIKRGPHLSPTRVKNSRQPGPASEHWEISVTTPRAQSAHQTAAISP